MYLKKLNRNFYKLQKHQFSRMEQMKAFIEIEDKIKINIEGSKDDIMDIIQYLQMKEETIKQYNETYERGINGNTITSTLIKLVENGFFDTEKDFKGVRKKLEELEIHRPSSTIHPVLTSMILKNYLVRYRGRDGFWRFIKTENYNKTKLQEEKNE